MKNIILGALLLPLIFIAGCKNQSGDTTQIIGPPPSTAPGSVTLSFDSAPSGVTQVVARLTRGGYSDRVLVLTFSDSSESAFGRLTDVAGGMWHLKVDALNNSGVILFTGETNVEVKAGQTALVSLQLLPATGNVEIHVTWGSGCAAVSSGLVSWWKAENNAEDGVGVNNGVLLNGVTFMEGRVGKAYSFANNGSYVRIPNSSTLNVTGSFTIEAWIYPTIDTIAIIFSKWGIDYGWSGQRSYTLDIWSGRQIRFGIADEYHQVDSAFQAFGSPLGVISLNQWNHIAGVYDRGTGKRRIYVNGLKVAERIDTPIDILQSRADVSIGGYLWSPYDVSHFFPGIIDEVSLYNRPLSNAEINAIFIAGSVGKCN